MLRALVPMMTLLILFPANASAEAAPSPGTNAALKYWRAFATMPKFTPAEEQRLANILTLPLDEQARAIVAKAEYSLRVMHSGAALPHCEWGIDWKEEGVEALLPQMTAARVLTSIACLRARMRFTEGQSTEAIEDLVAALTLGHHVSLDGSLIGVLVGYSIEARVYETLAAGLPRLDARLLANLKQRLDAVPAGNRPALAIRQCEENTLDWFSRRVKQAKDKESLVRLLSFLGVSEGKPDEGNRKARAFIEECGGSAEGVLKFIEEARPSYAQMARILDLPLDQFESESDRELKKQAKNPVSREFLPAVAKVRQSQARAEVRRALFGAALAVAREGRDALKSHPDPVAGGSFEYTPFEGGFELQSNFKGADGKSVKLTVGQRG
jgi:hypothetical protein